MSETLYLHQQGLVHGSAGVHSNDMPIVRAYSASNSCNLKHNLIEQLSSTSLVDTQRTV
jgi:hypothetical protein